MPQFVLSNGDAVPDIPLGFCPDSTYTALTAIRQAEAEFNEAVAL